MGQRPARRKCRPRHDANAGCRNPLAEAILNCDFITKENCYYESRIYRQRTCAIGPYSQALDLGNMVFVSGQLPVDPATGTMADTVEQQAAQSLANLKAILAEAGLSMNNVVKTVIFLADINDFAAVNAEYAKAFAEPFPARSCVQVAAIPKGAKLEIECIAVRG